MRAEDFTQKELVILREALTNFYIELRSVKQVAMSEERFLESDAFSDGRKQNYLIAKDLCLQVKQLLK